MTPENVQHQFAFDMFLSRLFSHGDCAWVLKGGTSLLLRIGSGRRSRDIDLARREQTDPGRALRELQVLVNDPGPTDPDFDFELKEPVRDNRDPGDLTRGSFKVLLKLGALPIVPFSVDISIQQYTDAPIEKVELNPVIEYKGLPAGTIIQMVPVENVAADKLCACYEIHRNEPSTRYHDLIDLVRIVTSQRMSASLLQELIASEAGARGLNLPNKMNSPGNRWQQAYPRQASKAAEFPAEYHELEAALEVVGTCLNPILSREPVTGIWDPEKQSWLA
ncbi:nucleotidyl transferase AbiEii/AbiGii toxin family protein [Corynebacterium sp. CCM 9185]|uniref:Nucleotidyl transferase AbiEii/AbiGii toxin family protein n=1 Tax=Corynebacterium marambiense TaxID=2765364 RepID=A0ABS0VWM1_9CORY|nr:nucleotidyl transferase AbiEii/AbiGii toxin family protein [Corynebacterium marambiense]MCK7663710.1 nucleotidyl transferase AbiEii/AbiGii toxin family protein [Corynebacterium marambiense]